ACHGAERQGDGDRTPSLVDVSERLTAGEVRQIVRTGRGFMPAFADLSEPAVAAVVSFLFGRDEPVAPASGAAPAEPPAVPYRNAGYPRFLDPDGYPAIKPPWGTLNAIDLDTGEYVWKVPLGEFPELTAQGIPPTGTENYGGPVVTAGGLVFIGAS